MYDFAVCFGAHDFRCSYDFKDLLKYRSVSKELFLNGRIDDFYNIHNLSSAWHLLQQ